MSSSLVNCQNGQENTASVLGFTTCRDWENLEVIQKGVTETMMGLESRSSEQRMWQLVLFFPRKGAEVGGDREYVDIIVQALVHSRVPSAPMLGKMDGLSMVESVISVQI